MSDVSLVELAKAIEDRMPKLKAEETSQLSRIEANRQIIANQNKEIEDNKVKVDNSKQIKELHQQAIRFGNS